MPRFKRTFRRAAYALALIACVAVADGSEVAVKAKLTAKSEILTPRQIAPYRAALVVYEYRVSKRLEGDLDADTIRVTHWQIVEKMGQSLVKWKVGRSGEMRLRPFSELPSLASEAISDTLPVNVDVPLFHHINQKVEFDEQIEERFNYRCDLTETMPAFFKLKDQLKLVALGDSRAVNGVRAELFYGNENLRTPVAYNLGIVSCPLDAQAILIRDYLMKAPKLEWVVFQIAPRLVNSRWGNNIARRVRRSLGYQHDQDHAAHIWRQNAEVVTTNDLLAMATVGAHWTARPYGWLSNGNRVWDQKRNKPGVTWEFSSERWELLESLLRELDAHGVAVMLYVSPSHRMTLKWDVVDEDGTSREAWADWLRRINALADDVDRVIFVDLHKGGDHDFDSSLFYDFDHVNERGAAELTRRLEWIRRANRALPR